ncbi:MAG: serine/threonine protein kinase [Acidobacteria bacterium]|nr:serine/threonine protein kinase [Acidobacteriota bacterium]MYK89441.1 serine/threonine protein kinase [Acidobacteriota bacterium]
MPRTSEDDRDSLVTEVADALSLRQEVDWERCARLATPSNRPLLDNLRLIARVASCFRASASAPTSPEPPPAGLRDGLFARRAVQALVGFAAFQSAATLLLLPWAWEPYHRELGDLAVYLATLLIGSSLSAALFLFGGRRDPRNWLLGAYFIVNATLANPFAMLASLRDIPQADLFGYPYVYPFLFAPAFLWAFVRECPRTQRATRLDDLARRMVVISAALGCVMWMGLVTVLELARAGYLSEAVFWACFDAHLALLELLRLGAVGVLLLRARTAPADEIRRVVLFAVGFLIWSGATAGYALVEAFSAGSWLSNYRWTPAVVVVELLRFPGIVLLWYAVLASRIPHAREVVRAFCMRLLARGGVLGGLAAAAALMLVWLLASRPERPVGAVVADPLAQTLAAATGILLLLVLRRERLLVQLDAWVYPETVEQRKALATAGTALARASRLATIQRTVKRTVWNGCGSPAVLLVAPDPLAEAHDFRAPDTRIAPLPRASVIVNVLEAAGGSLRVHPNDATSFFGLLPAADATWVVEADADVLAPVPGAGAELLGVLVVGLRFDSRPVRLVDIPFLEAVAAAAGLAVGRLAVAHGPGEQVRREEPPAQECPVCRCLREAGEALPCDCGSEYVEAEVPKLLAGKYRLTRRLGSGGMGRVYLARDLWLDRDVAVKTLADISDSRLQGLKPEAWAMATVSHPAIAHIYGIESWCSRPFLVVEFLGGGTLADRLDRERVPPHEALSMTTLLADALAALHEAGYVHGDIKPSNIGFTASGSPKLLDFGLARQSADADAAGGTLRYLSPEVLAGRPADEADDVWSLCVVLHEMATGEHPFVGGDPGEVANRIRRQRPVRPARPAPSDKTPSAVTDWTVAMLSAPRSARPATAREFAVALHAHGRRHTRREG